MTIQIKNRYTNEVIYTSEKETLKEVVEEAVSKGVSLAEADLSEANLSKADFYHTKFYGRGGTTKISKSQVDDFLKALGVVVV